MTGLGPTATCALTRRAAAYRTSKEVRAPHHLEQALPCTSRARQILWPPTSRRPAGETTPEATRTRTNAPSIVVARSA